MSVAQLVVGLFERHCGESQSSEPASRAPAGRWAALSARWSDHGMANGVASAGLKSVRLCARLVVAAFLSFIERTCFEAEKVRDDADGEGEGDGEDDGEGEGDGDAPAAPPPPPPPGVRGGRAPAFPPPPPPPPRCCDFEAGVCMANERRSERRKKKKAEAKKTCGPYFSCASQRSQESLDENHTDTGHRCD